MPMRLSRRFAWAVLFVFGVLAGSSRADEPFLRFVRGLHEMGHGELAAHYLNMVKDRPDLPEDLKTTWDLEMARSLRIAAERTPNVDVQQQQIVQAQQFLDKFLKEQANHAEAASAQLTSGDISLLRGQSALRIAMRDKTKRDTLLPEARKLLEEARPKYEKAASMYKARVDQVRAGDGGKKKTTGRVAALEREELFDAWFNARFKVATVDYDIGLTYPGTKDLKRKEALAKAAKGFDDIWQENRNPGNPHFRIGVYAHMWEGKVREESEDFVTALEIYEEVMSNQPEKNDKREALWFAMFNEVNRYRLMLLGRTKAYEQLIGDASLWLAQHDRIKRSSGYQGIALELTKALLEFSKTAKPADFDRLERSLKERGLTTTALDAATLKQRARTLIADCAATPGEFQKDAILLKRMSSGQGEEAPISTFDEAIAIGDAATKAAGEATAVADAKANWQEAEKAYTKAIELSADVKDKNRLLNCRFALAWAQYMVGKAAESYDTALNLAKENPTFTKAPAAAALAVNVALYLYGQTRDNPALERINAATGFLLQQFPQHAEADDARIASGKLKLIQGDLAGAITTFGSVNPASDRHPIALHLAGQTYWQLYVIGKQKTDATKAAETKTNRTKAVELLQQSLTAQQKIQSGQALSQQLQDTQLLLAEVHLEGGQPAEASTLLDPLVLLVKDRPPMGIDKYTLRVFVAAVRSYAALNELAKARDVGTLLLAGGEDVPPINGVLVEFSRLLRGEWKQKAAVAIAAEQNAAEAEQLDKAKMDEAEIRKRYTEFLTQLATRKQYDLAGLVFLGESCAEVGLTDNAREQLEIIVDRAATDPAFNKQAAKALINVRAQLIGLDRAEGEFDEALKQVDALLKDQPNALEPLMEKGHLLQALAEKDPKRYDETIKWWTNIRMKLHGQTGKKPPAYYEVIYNCAVCLVAQKTAEKNTQAVQLLNSTLALSPNLDGPDRVEKYKALLKQLPASKAVPATTKSKTTAKSK